MENLQNIKVEKSVNDTEKKCIKISVPKFVYEKDDPVDLDRELFMRAKREFPNLEFLDKLLQTEENGNNIDFLFYYK